MHKNKPVSVLDVSAYILKKYQKKHPTLTAWKLPKLVYYCQAWSLVWKDYKPGERGETEINLATMHEYYSSIDKRFQF